MSATLTPLRWNRVPEPGNGLTRFHADADGHRVISATWDADARGWLLKVADLHRRRWELLGAYPALEDAQRAGDLYAATTAYC